MMNMRKTFALVLSLLMLAACVPVHAEDAAPEAGTTYAGFLTGRFYTSDYYQSDDPSVVFVSAGALGEKGDTNHRELWLKLPEGMTESDLSDDGVVFTVAEPIVFENYSDYTAEELEEMGGLIPPPPVEALPGLKSLSVVDGAIREVKDGGKTISMEVLLNGGYESKDPPEFLELTIADDAYINGLGEAVVHGDNSGALICYDADTMEAFAVFHVNG